MHPEKFEEAKQFEKGVAQKKYSWRDNNIEESGHGYTWLREGSLEDVVEKAEGK